MIANKYGNFLTIVLIIIIVGLVIGVGIIVYNNFIEPNIKEKKSAEAIAQFDKNFTGDIDVTADDLEKNQNTETNNQEQNIVNNTSNSANTQKTTKKRTYYENFVMLGYITIKKTNVKLPILLEITPKALDTAVGIAYPSNPKLNEPGNVVIIGHNYRNGKFFSNNKKLSIGDTIKIKDEQGRELVYTIYNKFETTPEDTTFYNRDTQGVPEITLSTCTDDNLKRLIILAKVQ